MSDADRSLAIIFPGVGYHKDKPLLYYAAQILRNKGFEIINIEYHDLPENIKGDADKMREAAELAYMQASLQLESCDLGSYDEVVLVGKSIGTVVMSRYAAEHKLKAGQIRYTPVEATFEYAADDMVAFIGDADPWSDVSEIRRIAAEHDIALYVYPDANHSLECKDTIRNIEILHDVMRITEEFLDNAL